MNRSAPQSCREPLPQRVRELAHTKFIRLENVQLNLVERISGWRGGGGPSEDGNRRTVGPRSDRTPKSFWTFFQERVPKRAVPMRTRVAPSSIATSKSPVTPIERVLPEILGKPQDSSSAAHSFVFLKYGRAFSAS